MPLGKTIPAVIINSFLIFGSTQTLGGVTVASGSPAKQLTCPKKMILPVTGSLNISSKYVQSEKTKSVVNNRRDTDSANRHKTINHYSKHIVKFVDHAIEQTGNAKGRVAKHCLNLWLSEWADAGALLSTDSSKTGVALRKWTLASIATATLKLEELDPDNWKLSDNHKRWFKKLADQVILDHHDRLNPRFKHFNNHDYWAAWAVASTGIVLNNTDYLNWSKLVFDRAMTQIVVSQDGQYGYLPNEIKRGPLAADYSHYSLVPLVMLQVFLPQNGITISQDARVKMAQLANFAVAVVEHPSRLKGIITVPQKAVKEYKTIWMIPYLTVDPKHISVPGLYRKLRDEIGAYSQAGGKLQHWFDRRARR